LNHPNIAAIYGLEDGDGVKALVMEFVEGEDLSQRTARGAIPLDDALPIAKQIAEALEAAHEQGIIHRDLKPANIKVREDGTVKVLDFGLAKAMEPAAGSSPSVSQSPTFTTPAVTEAGMILGTAAYMSPEQARGKTIDKRTDVWAFGCVLFEMLTGRAAFEGDSAAEVLGRVLTTEPAWAHLPHETPESIRRLLRRCLRKDRENRLRDIGDARLELDDGSHEPGTSDESARPVQRRERLVWISAVALASLVAVVAGGRALRRAPLPSELRLEINTPQTTDLRSFAIAPDGQKIVFVASADGLPSLWLRSLDADAARPLPGTEFALSPFWSPDGRSVGFASMSRLKRTDLDGGSVQQLANSLGRGAAWNDDGVILFVGPEANLLRISASGGSPSPVTRVEAPQQQAHIYPQFLPDGRHFLFYVEGTPAARGIYVGELDRKEIRRLRDADSAAVFSPSGHLLFISGGTLFAQDFAPDRSVLSGDPFRIADQVEASGLTNAGASASAAGVIGYRKATSAGQRQLVWFDRTGHEIGKIGDPDSAQPVNPSMSPDGRTVAVNRAVDGNNDIWLIETAGSHGTVKFTTDAAIDFNPIWSPDGRRVLFNSFRSGQPRVYVQLANGTPGSEQSLPLPPIALPVDWSTDGRFLLYNTTDPKTGIDLWALPMDGGRKAGEPLPVVQTNADERDGQFSPDGKWVAYQSNETGRFEIYVKAFPDVGRRPQLVSVHGGEQVRWRRDSNELFYIGTDNRLMAVPVRLAPDSQSIESDPPVGLFPTRVLHERAAVLRQQYIVSADGRQFLINTEMDEHPTPITLIFNWKAKR
jgi:Tol biopolymer transport system component